MAGAALFQYLRGRIQSGLQARGCANSFMAGTLVLMADRTTKPIEDIQIGDWVWAEDPELGESGPRQVTALIVDRGEKQLVDVEIDGAKITATYNHPFWDAACCGWVYAEDIRTGFEVLTSGGYTLDVDAVQSYTVPDATVYNFTVDGLHTYFVLAGDQPVLVHNCPSGGGPSTPHEPVTPGQHPTSGGGSGPGSPHGPPSTGGHGPGHGGPNQPGGVNGLTVYDNNGYPHAYIHPDRWPEWFPDGRPYPPQWLPDNIPPPDFPP